MQEAITPEEKIDYIYHMLKKNQQKALFWSIFKWLYRITILGYMYYFFMISLPSIIDKIPSFSHPWESMNMEEIMNSPKVKEWIESYIRK